MRKKNYKIGDAVTATLTTRGEGGKKKVRGKIKNIEVHYGQETYTITGGVVEDFKTRNIK